MCKPLVIYTIMPATNGGTATPEEYHKNIAKAAEAALSLHVAIHDSGIQRDQIRIICPQVMFEELYGVVPYDEVMRWCITILEHTDLSYYPVGSETSKGVEQEIQWCAARTGDNGEPNPMTIFEHEELIVNFAKDYLHANS